MLLKETAAKLEKDSLELFILSIDFNCLLVRLYVNKVVHDNIKSYSW